MSNESMDKPEAAGFGLVMPFVVTESHGGPFADEPFVAGYECGMIYARLAVIAAAEGDSFSATVRASNLPQLDLIAMLYGFHHTEGKCADDSGEWAYWRCSRTVGGSDD